MLKVAVVGDINVGKSSLVSRFVYRNKAPSVEHTIGVDITVTSLFVHGKVHRVKFFDLTGSYFYETLYDNYLLNAESIIVVYDVTRLKTFIKAKLFIKKIIKIHSEDYPIILVGNKMDNVAKRRVDLSHALGYVKGVCNTYYIETSAKHGGNTLDCLRMLISEASRNQKIILTKRVGEAEVTKCNIV
jgi:small GTP-binding protein